MSDGPPVLVIAATSFELAAHDGFRALVCGVGPVEAASATAAAIAEHRPQAIVHVGIAGASRRSALEPGTVVIGSESVYCDLIMQSSLAPRQIAAPAEMLNAAVRAAPGAHVQIIGTSARVAGSSGCDPIVHVEAMEGFAVLRAAQRAGIPAIEIRAISNAIEETDRRLWKFDTGFAAITAITPAIVREVQRELARTLSSSASD